MYLLIARMLVALGLYAFQVVWHITWNQNNLFIRNIFETPISNDILQCPILFWKGENVCIYLSV